MTSYLADRKVLLILDNFEHVLPASEFVAELLGASSDLRILVTSRSPLHVSGEQEFPVPPLLLPEPAAPVSAASLAGCESAQLFAARAAASVPGSPSRARTLRPSRESCNDSTGCHWRSSWRRRG